MYYIEKDNKILFVDENKNKLITTLSFQSNLTEEDIKEVPEGYIIKDFKLMTIEDVKKEEEKASTSFDENQQAAINAVLANAGLGQEDVTDIGCTLDEATQQYTVTFTFQDIHNTCVVDAATFTVLSSVQA